MKLSTNSFWQDISNLLDMCEESQWDHTAQLDDIKNLPLLTKDMLRELEMKDDVGVSTTSGSTGQPVTVGKSYEDIVWHHVANLRQLIWRNWDVTKTLAVINLRSDNQQIELPHWEIPFNIAEAQGTTYVRSNAPIAELQKWIEEKNPHYVVTNSDILKELDFSKVSNFIDAKGYGGDSSASYSSEECGVIALECPDNPSVMHVMENILVEVADDGEGIITVLSNKYLKRYLIGDIIELGECTCGRTLQVIKSVRGRKRNMLTLPDGNKIFPLLGSRSFYSEFGIKQYQAIQTHVSRIELHIICEPLGEREAELRKLVCKWLGIDIDIEIIYVDSFANYKHQEFISLL